MEQVHSKDGTVIAFDRLGEGPAVILVDGAFCSRGFGPMPGLAPLLAPHFTVYHYDRRGRNESGDTLPYAVEREVEDLRAVIEAAGGSACVFGISSGVVLALEAAVRGGSVEKLALYEPPYLVANDTDPRPPEDAAARITALAAAGRRGEAVAYFMTRVLGAPADAIAGMRQAPIWPAFEAVAHTLAYDVTVMGDWSFPAERMAAITVPTLAMDGGASPAWAGTAAQRIADTLPHAQRRTLEGQTHEVAAEALAPVLVQFFSGSNGTRHGDEDGSDYSTSGGLS